MIPRIFLLVRHHEFLCNGKDARSGGYVENNITKKKRLDNTSNIGDWRVYHVEQRVCQSVHKVVLFRHRSGPNGKDQQQ